MTKGLRLRKVATPRNARSGQETVFVDRDDHHVKSINSAGSVTDLESGGGGGSSVTVANTDPGAIGAGNLWVQSGASVTPYVMTWLRNAADDGWLLVSTLSQQESHGDIDIWDPSFQTNLYLAAFGSTTRPTRLLDGNNGIAIGQGSLGGVTIITEGGLTSKTTSPRLLSLAADPSAGGGIAAPVGTLALRNNSNVGALWVKYGAGDTQWRAFLTAGDLTDLLAPIASSAATVAGFVDPSTGTAEDIITALIAAGLMAAS